MAEFPSEYDSLRQKIRNELERSPLRKSTASVLDLGGTGTLSFQSPMIVPQQSPYSPVRDHVAELNSLRYELTLSVEKYSTMALCKEAADTRIHEMQSDADANYYRITQLETELNRSRYESDVIRNDYETQKKEFDAHAMQWQSSAVLSEQRIVELEKQLQTHSVTASEVTAQKSNTDKQLHNLEEKLGQSTEELSEMTKKYSALQAINVSIESSNAQLLIQLEKDMASITSRDNRIKELEASHDRVSAQLMETTAANATNLKNIVDLESHTEKDHGQIVMLKQQLSDASMERTTMIRRHSDETTTLRAELLACQSSAAASRATYEGTIADLNILVQQSNAEIQSMKKQISELTALKGTLESTVTELQNQTRKDAYDVEHLTRQITDLTATHATTKTALEKTISTMESVNRKGNDEITLLKNRLFDLESHLRTCTDDNEKLNKSVHDMTITHNDLTKERESLQGKIRQFQEEMVGLRQQADLATSNETARIHAEKTIMSLESQSRKDQLDIDRLKKQLVDVELSERKVLDEKQRQDQVHVVPSSFPLPSSPLVIIIIYRTFLNLTLSFSLTGPSSSSFSSLSSSSSSGVGRIDQLKSCSGERYRPFEITRS